MRLDTAGDVACIYVAGELDLATATHLADCVALALTAIRTTQLMLDLGGMTFCDSAGLQAMVNAQRACRKRGIGMVLRQPSDTLREILKIAGLGDHFTVEL